MKTKSRFRISRIILFIIIVLLIIIARPAYHLISAYVNDKNPVNTEKAGYTNDASNLNETKIATLVKIAPDTGQAIIQICSLIKQAKLEGKKISIAGAQHSMGGHTIYPDGIVLDMKGFNYLAFDSAQNILLTGSGALWSQIIPYLDTKGRSIAVMQSNNSFSVGGSISVNCHGWQPNSSPIASTVQSFRLINSDGEIVNCSRTENRELFSLALGGYGLFGVILDVKLKVIENRMYKARQYIIKSSDYIREFDKVIKETPGIGMIYGRININPGNFMEEAILSTFTVDNTMAVESLQKNKYASFRRTVFRGSANSGYGKDLRWRAEKLSTSLVSGRTFSRNQLLNEGVDVFENTDTAYTDILHEYFIPKDSVTKFIARLQVIMPKYNVDLLNITLRNIKKDDDTFLRYANEEVFGFVMLFNQAKGNQAEADMKFLTRNLINEAISLRGTYYLPYRLHASREQLYTVYPQAPEFFMLKKKYDPAEIFQNQFYKAYK